MKQAIGSLLRQFVFWLALIVTERTIFLIWYSKTIFREGIPLSEVILVYWHALRLDLSTASYILLIPFLLIGIQLFVNVRWFDSLNKLYTAIIVIVYISINMAEIGLYEEWNTKLSFKALTYLERPAEVLNSAQTSSSMILFFLVIIQSTLFIYIYNKFVYRPVNFRKIKLHPTARVTFIIVMSIIFFIAIRGGLKEIPITASASYFSKNNILNIAAVNPGYNIVFSVLDHADFSDLEPFFKFTDEEAQQIVKDIHYLPIDTTIRITEFEQPNIVFVLLESWPADVIESLGGDAGITPEFKKLEENGLLFTNFYASGNRSQQGNASIYAGLPALPITTLSDHPEKYSAVPSLVKILNRDGYHSSFYFGGQLIYGNLKSFIVYNEFDRIIEGNDFEEEVPRGKLGVHDEFLFDQYAKDLREMPQPFFSTVFTLSSHSPYDYPGEQPIDWIDLEHQFVNSVHYTDRCLGEFFEKVYNSPIWDNTLFLIMSDHSHLSYKGYPLWSFEYHQIPLLITGGALKNTYKGKKIDRIGSNTDIPVTVLKQLNLDTDAFFWSKNMMNPYTPEFAFFELTDGFGWKRPDGDLVKSAIHKWYYQKNAPPKKLPELEKEGYAYIQVLLKEFLNY